MTRRTTAGALLVVAALGVAAPACSDDDDGETTPDTTTLEPGDQPGSGGDLSSVPQREQDRGATPGGSDAPDAEDETQDRP
jgi:hypothetical protein